MKISATAHTQNRPGRRSRLTEGVLAPRRTAWLTGANYRILLSGKKTVDRSCELRGLLVFAALKGVIGPRRQARRLRDRRGRLVLLRRRLPRSSAPCRRANSNARASSLGGRRFLTWLKPHRVPFVVTKRPIARRGAIKAYVTIGRATGEARRSFSYIRSAIYRGKTEALNRSNTLTNSSSRFCSAGLFGVGSRYIGAGRSSFGTARGCLDQGD